VNNLKTILTDLAYRKSGETVCDEFGCMDQPVGYHLLVPITPDDYEDLDVRSAARMRKYYPDPLICWIHLTEQRRLELLGCVAEKYPTILAMMVAEFWATSEQETGCETHKGCTTSRMLTAV